MRAEQIRLDADQVPIPARVIQHRLNPRLLLDEHRERQRADACACALAVGDVDHVDALTLQSARAIHHHVGLKAARRQQFDRRDERAARHGMRQPRLLLARDRWRRNRRLDSSGGAAGGGRRAHDRRRHAADRCFDLPNVLRRRPAAAADDAYAVENESAGVGCHVLRRAEIDVPALHVARLACVWLRRQLQRRHRLHPLDRVEHRRRTHGAVDADHGRAAPLEFRSEAFGRGAVQRVTVLLGGHLRDDRQVRYASHRVDSGTHLVQVTKRFEDEELDAAFGERRRLLAEIFARFVDAGFAPRFDADAERPYRARDVRAIVRRVTRDSRALCVDRVESVGQAERSKFDAVRAECIRLDDIGARTNVFLMDFRDEIRLRHVQRIEALVDEHALRVQHRAHRAVADEHAVVEGVQEWL